MHFDLYFREEDEYEDSAVQSNKSNDGGSRAANESQANSLGQGQGRSGLREAGWSTN